MALPQRWQHQTFGLCVSSTHEAVLASFCLKEKHPTEVFPNWGSMSQGCVATLTRPCCSRSGGRSHNSLLHLLLLLLPAHCLGPVQRVGGQPVQHFPVRGGLRPSAKADLARVDGFDAFDWLAATAWLCLTGVRGCHSSRHCSKATDAKNA